MFTFRAWNTSIRQCGHTMNIRLKFRVKSKIHLLVKLSAAKLLEKMLFVYLQATELRKPDFFFKPITHTCTSIETVVNSDVLWKPPDRNFPINSHTLASIRPRYGGNNDIMVTAGLLAERRRLWAGERKRHYVCVCVCFLKRLGNTSVGWGKKTFEAVHQAVHGIRVFH